MLLNWSWLIWLSHYLLTNQLLIQAVQTEFKSKIKLDNVASFFSAIIDQDILLLHFWIYLLDISGYLRSPALCLGCQVNSYFLNFRYLTNISPLKYRFIRACKIAIRVCSKNHLLKHSGDLYRYLVNKNSVKVFMSNLTNVTTNLFLFMISLTLQKFLMFRDNIMRMNMLNIPKWIFLKWFKCC